MILTVCLSPCIDVTIEVDSINVGKLNFVKSKFLTYTGKALNVAIGVSRLQKASFATGFMYNENGVMFEKALDNESVPYSFVWNEGRVRENYKIIDDKSMMTEINDTGELVSNEKQDELLKTIDKLAGQADVVVVSGSAPRGVDATFYKKIFDSLPDKCIKVADTEGSKLIESCKANVNLIKPNFDEIQSTLKRELKTKEDLLEGCKILLDYGAQNVLLSLGKNGAIITNGSKTYYTKSHNVAVNNTLGAGDGMVSAASVALEQGADLAEILRCGVAAGTATITTFNKLSFAKEKFDAIYAGLKVEQI